MGVPVGVGVVGAALVVGTSKISGGKTDGNGAVVKPSQMADRAKSSGYRIRQPEWRSARLFGNTVLNRPSILQKTAGSSETYTRGYKSCPNIP